MKSYRTALIGACALIAASCSHPSARIDGTLTGAAEKEVIVKLLNVNTYNVLDTIKTDKSGAFSYKVDVKEGQPEFIHLFYGDQKLSSLILSAGDVVKVTADTLGNSSVTGSPETELLLSAERDFAQFLADVDAAENEAKATQLYVKHYRDAVRFVLENKGSLAVVPVLFQNVYTDVPVFGQITDALHFRSTLDTLKQLYPQSAYVKSLETETLRREQLLALNSQLSQAKEMGYPDITSTDVNGKTVKLSEIDAKVILIHFWTATDAASKVFNLETLKPIYADYHKKGFEILMVSLDTDKAAWATVVKNQELPWINVNDGLGANSPALSLYNVSQLPQSYLIVDGEIVDRKIDGESAFRKVLEKSL